MMRILDLFDRPLTSSSPPPHANSTTSHYDGTCGDGTGNGYGDRRLFIKGFLKSGDGFGSGWDWGYGHGYGFVGGISGDGSGYGTGIE